MALTASSTDHKAIFNTTRIGGSATEPDLLHATMESKVLFSQKDNRSCTRVKAPKIARKEGAKLSLLFSVAERNCTT
jgi:hypothetical protein